MSIVTREFVHHLKYEDKDCISEHLRVLFPTLHSSFCDRACADLVEYVKTEVDETMEEEDFSECVCGDDGCIHGR